MKTCTECNIEKPNKQFHKSKRGKFGRFSICAKCRNDYYRKRNNKPNPDISNKTCLKCSQIKEIKEFAISKQHSDGYYSYCKQCQNAIGRKRYKENNEFYKQYSIFQRYGITPEFYEKLFKKQGNKCAICNTDQKHFKKPLYIDHCHNSKKIRGLLCVNCNTGLGMFKDDINILEIAIKYLRKAD